MIDYAAIMIVLETLIEVPGKRPTEQSVGF